MLCDVRVPSIWTRRFIEVYGEKKEGADFAYNNTWSYSVLYGKTGDLLYIRGYRHTTATHPRTFSTLGEQRMRCRQWLLCCQKLVQICAARGVEFFIVAKKHANVMKAVHA